jgi:DNA transposition AAA+ family ATPase
MTDGTPKKTVTGQAIDALMAQHRQLGESRMIRSDRTTESITQEEIDAVLAKVKEYLKATGITQNRVAKIIMYKPSTLSQVLKGTYGADVRPVIVALDRWLERQVNADAIPEVDSFVWTAVAERVLLGARQAIAMSDAGMDTRISLVWGDPGCGKTKALQAVAEKFDGILITCGVEVSSPRAILEKIAVALGLPLTHFTRILFAAVVEKLRGTGKLIIVDEIHSLLETRDDSAFHTLRRLSDEAGVPQLWSATCDLIEQLRVRETKREPLGQIVSRIGSQFHLTAGLGSNGVDGGKGEPLYTVEEILKIYGRNELRLTRDAARFLARLCTNRRHGLLRACTALVMNATLLNRGKATELSAELLWKAAQFLFQSSVLESLKPTLHQELKEFKLKIA